MISRYCGRLRRKTKTPRLLAWAYLHRAGLSKSQDVTRYRPRSALLPFTRSSSENSVWVNDVAKSDARSATKSDRWAYCSWSSAISVFSSSACSRFPSRATPARWTMYSTRWFMLPTRAYSTSRAVESTPSLWGRVDRDRLTFIGRPSFRLRRFWATLLVGEA